MSLAYDDTFPFSTNIADLATALAADVRNLEERRSRVASGPNAESLKAVDIADLDSQLTPLRYQASAAAEGLLWWDPASISGVDSRRQTWVARARERGRLVTPATYGPSVHDLDQQQPILVNRGAGQPGDALGSPSFGMR